MPATTLVRKFTADQCNKLDAPVTREEVKIAIFSVANGKAPGPDGYSADFFKNNWEIVGEHVIYVVMEFFVNGKMPKAWNSTVLTLIPKIPIPNTMKDLRPIACCNVLYKCISKVIVHRLKKVKAFLVGTQQTAFIEGRDIVDNVLFMQEIMKNYHKTGGAA